MVVDENERKGRNGLIWRKNWLKVPSLSMGKKWGLESREHLRIRGQKQQLLWFEFGVGPWEKSCGITREGVSLHGGVNAISTISAPLSRQVISSVAFSPQT